MRHVVGVAFAALMLAPSAQAETRQVCEPQVIVELSERILANRADAGRFAVRRTGAAASYLRMHYADISEEEMLAFWRDLALADRDTELAEARDMALALAVSRDGFEEGLRFFGGQPADEVVATGYSLQRALILEDAGERYYRLMAEIVNDPDREAVGNQTNQVLQLQVRLFVDQEDAFLRQLSINAEAWGHVHAAVAVAANMQDKTRLEALAQRYGEDEFYERVLGREVLDIFAVTWRTQARTYRPDPVRQQQDLFDISRADSFSGAAVYLSVLVNLTGRTEEVGQVARAYLAAVQAGHVDPIVHPEDAWLMQYEALVQEMSLAEVQRTMAGIRWPNTLIRHFAGSGAETMDRMVTYVSFGPVMAGAAFPPRPAMLSQGADWEEFEAFVVALARGELPTPAGTEEAFLGFELLWRDGQYDQAIAYAQQWFEPPARLTAFADVSARMDGLCDAVLAYPARGYLFGGQEIYRFPPEPQR